jgi:hypothetical protein
MKKANLSILFKAEPEWGFRGDPYLWADMKLYFKKVEQPANGEEFRQLVLKAFKELTGEELNPYKIYAIKKYAHGGMTSGGIHGYHWYCTLLPELTERFLAYALNPKSVRVITDHCHHRKLTRKELKAEAQLIRKLSAVYDCQNGRVEEAKKEYPEFADYIESIKGRNYEEVMDKVDAEIRTFGF